MKISIIVPIYNVEKYIRKCIISIINQTYKNIEIILVDDGSPDNCPMICDEFARRDERIVVIHKKNGGLSSARNAGLEKATGDYIGFVDSDDWIEPQMYEKMIQMYIDSKVDLVECGINLYSAHGVKLFDEKTVEIVSGYDALFRHLSLIGRTGQSMPRTAVWSKLFRRDFWSNRRFPEGKIHEDYMITCEALYSSNLVGFVNVGLLNHLVDNPNSIVNAKFSSKDLYKETQLYNRINYLKQKGCSDLVKLAEADYYNYLVSVVIRIQWMKNGNT